MSSLRGQLGVIPQEPFLFSGSVRDNLTFARPDATEEEVLATARAVGLGELLDRLPEGLDTPVHERGVALSSGERHQVLTEWNDRGGEESWDGPVTFLVERWCRDAGLGEGELITLSGPALALGALIHHRPRRDDAGATDTR